jgi:hypothetical protein
LIPDVNSPSPSFLTSYGAIKSINILGSAYILDIIVPVMDKVLATLNKNLMIKMNFNFNNNTDNKKFSNNKNDHNTQYMDIHMGDTIEYQQVGGSLPKINFSLPLMAGHMPIVSSMFSEISNTNVIDSRTGARVEQEIERDGGKCPKIRLELDKKMFYVYYALKESATLVLNFIANNDFENNKDKFVMKSIFEKFYDIFGEDIIPNFLSNRNIGSNIGLDLVV